MEQGDQTSQAIAYASALTNKQNGIAGRDSILAGRVARALGLGYIAVGLILGILLSLAIGNARDGAVAFGPAVAVFWFFALPGFILAMLSSAIRRGNKASTVGAMVTCGLAMLLLGLAALATLIRIHRLPAYETKYIAIAAYILLAVGNGNFIYHAMRALIVAPDTVSEDIEVGIIDGMIRKTFVIAGLNHRHSVVCLSVCRIAAGLVLILVGAYCVCRSMSRLNDHISSPSPIVPWSGSIDDNGVASSYAAFALNGLPQADQTRLSTLQVDNFVEFLRRKAWKSLPDRALPIVMEVLEDGTLHFVVPNARVPIRVWVTSEAAYESPRDLTRTEVRYREMISQRRLLQVNPAIAGAVIVAGLVSIAVAWQTLSRTVKNPRSEGEIRATPWLTATVLGFIATTLLAANYIYSYANCFHFSMAAWIMLAIIWLGWWGIFGGLIPTRFVKRFATDSLQPLSAF